jgi:hypothetical protein
MTQQDPNAAEWTVDEAFRYLTRRIGPPSAIFALNQAALSGRLQVTCRHFIIVNGKRVLKKEAIVRPDLWRDLLKFAFVDGRVQVKPTRIGLEPGEYEYTLPAQAVRELLRTSPAASKSSKRTESKPGSAGAWIDELYPDGGWRLRTATEIHRNIARAAKDRELREWPALRTVQRELKKRQQA